VLEMRTSLKLRAHRHQEGKAGRISV